MNWLDSLEFEIEWRIREIIREHGGPIEVTAPKVNRLFQNLAGVRRAKEVHYERDRHRLSA